MRKSVIASLAALILAASGAGLNLVANFAPTATGTSGKGYQAPSLSNGTDQANFPAFLCRTGLPYGIATSSCN